jgi:hypothetical protein
VSIISFVDTSDPTTAYEGKQPASGVTVTEGGPYRRDTLYRTVAG